MFGPSSLLRSLFGMHYIQRLRRIKALQAYGMLNGLWSEDRSNVTNGNNIDNIQVFTVEIYKINTTIITKHLKTII